MCRLLKMLWFTIIIYLEGNYKISCKGILHIVPCTVSVVFRTVLILNRKHLFIRAPIFYLFLEQKVDDYEK